MTPLPPLRDGGGFISDYSLVRGQQDSVGIHKLPWIFPNEQGEKVQTAVIYRIGNRVDRDGKRRIKKMLK